MKERLIVPAVLLVLGLALGGCPQPTGEKNDDSGPNYPPGFTPVSPSVTFDSNDGSSRKISQTIGKGTVSFPERHFDRDGYGVVGWYREPACENPWDFVTDTVSVNTTLYAKWEPAVTSLSGLSAWLGSQPQTGSASDPKPLPVSIDLTRAEYGLHDLFAAIAAQPHHVKLDLRSCGMAGTIGPNSPTMGAGSIRGTVFDPDNTILAGKDKIVELILPYPAKTIVNASNTVPAFAGFTKLKSVEGPHITGIGDYAFTGSSSLTSAKFPLATAIGIGAFIDCTSLVSVRFQTAAKITAGNPFRGCTSLVSFDLIDSGEQFQLSVSEGGKALISGAKIVAYPTASGNLTLTNGTIGRDAFAGCTGLLSIDMPRGYYIDNNAFEGCTNLVSASFEAGWLVGDNAFAGCTSLTSVSVPEVRSIGYRAFAQTGTTGLSITMGEKAPPLGRNIFEGASSKSVTVHVPDAATGYDASWESAFKGLGSNGIGTVNSGISLSVTSP